MSFIHFIEFSGTFIFAISGVMAAVQRKFDIVGAFIIGLVTATGGGTIRDVLIDSTPVFWMENEWHILVIFLSLPFCYFFRDLILRLRNSFFLFDTIGIGFFTVVGLQKTLDAGLSPLIALMMGIVSAVFGGVSRDVLCNEVPLIFRKEIYATACLTGGLVYLLMNSLLPGDRFNLIISILVVILIRYFAVRYSWELPFKPLQRKRKSNN